MEWVQLIGGWVFSWPVAVVIVVFSFKKQSKDWLENVTKVKAGPVQIQRELRAVAEAGKDALDTVGQMIILLGESRMTELQVTLKTVGLMFSEADKVKMQQEISKIGTLLQGVKGEKSKRGLEKKTNKE